MSKFKIGDKVRWVKDVREQRRTKNYCISDKCMETLLALPTPMTVQSVDSLILVEDPRKWCLVPDWLELAPDKVRIRSWESMEAQYGVDGAGDINVVPGRFVEGMRPLCGMVIDRIAAGGHVAVNTPDGKGWYIYPEMTEEIPAASESKPAHAASLGKLIDARMAKLCAVPMGGGA